jgi:isopenicillin-N N-acyltransferase-like protein
MTTAIDRRSFLASLAALGVTACTRTAPRTFPELRAAGAPGDLGLAQGRAFADRIRSNLDFYLDWLSLDGEFPPAALLELARGFAPVLEAHFPDMLEEIDGIARGAGLSLDEVLLINARTDIMAMVDAASTAHAIPACTALALRGKAGGRSALALAQNWDWDPVLADAPVILRLRPADGPALVTLVEAGMIGKIGFNEHRLGVCLNFLSHVDDGEPGRFGVPVHCLLRAVQNCATLDEAVAAVAFAPRGASANFLLAQHTADGPHAVDLEVAPNAVAEIPDRGGDLIHTNHYLSATLATGCTSGRGPSTMKRQARAEQLAAELGETVADPVRRAQRVLESRANLPYPISRHGNPDPSSSTLAGIVMDLTGNRFVVAAGPPHLEPWVELPGV